MHVLPRSFKAKMALDFKLGLNCILFARNGVAITEQKHFQPEVRRRKNKKRITVSQHTLTV